MTGRDLQRGQRPPAHKQVDLVIGVDFFLKSVTNMVYCHLTQFTLQQRYVTKDRYNRRIESQ